MKKIMRKAFGLDFFFKIITWKEGNETLILHTLNIVQFLRF